MPGDEVGVLIPADASGRRSSSALGRAVVADALREVDPVGAAGAERESNWRSGYPEHFRRVLEAGLQSHQAAVRIASDGLDSLQRRMQYRPRDGSEQPLDTIDWDQDGPSLSTEEVRGDGEAETQFSLPLGGDRLTGDALARQLESWSAAGVLEQSAVDAVRAVMAHPEWLRLDGHTVVVLGAGAEMGPLPALLRWGARVAAVDLPAPAIWRRVLAAGRGRAGTLLVPVAAGSVSADSVADRAGVDVLSELRAAAHWITNLEGRIVLGNYVYADGVTNLRLSAAVDALTVALQDARPDLALAFLATPTDVFAVSKDVMAHSLRPTTIARGRRSFWRSRCGPCLPAGCYDGSTCRAWNQACTTRSSHSRDRTTRWPNGCSDGERRLPAMQAARCR